MKITTRSQTLGNALSTSEAPEPIASLPPGFLPVIPNEARFSTRTTGRIHIYPAPASQLPAHVFELSSPTLPADKARTLLRRLRDLNLTAGPVAVTHDLWVVIGGCISLDGPAENGVRYRLRQQDGGERTLEIGWRGSRLALSLRGRQDDECRDLDVPVTCDRRGRACVRAIGARVGPESTDRRELEHFLRRVVRALLK